MVVIMVCVFQINKKWFENMTGWYHEYTTIASTNGGNFINCTIASWFDAVNDTLKTYIAGASPSFDFVVNQNMDHFILVDKENSLQGEG